MRYVMSDIHGEYELFEALVERLSVGAGDTIYIAGDIIDKGSRPIKLLNTVTGMKNVRCILGNHEYEFLKYYHSLIDGKNTDYDKVLSCLEDYLGGDDTLTWESVDYLDSLPSYIEEDDIIIVHSGAPTDSSGLIMPLSEASVEELVYDRRFKEPGVIPRTDKCVFFGHTEVSVISGENKIIAYKSSDARGDNGIQSLCKVHLDTGCWHSGVLGCFAVEECRCYYAIKQS